MVASHLRPLGIPYDADLLAALAPAGETLGAVRGNASILLNGQGVDADTVADYVARWGLMSRARAVHAVTFLSDPTWRAYVFCYLEGVRLCRRFVAGDAQRFGRLLTEQLVPADLVAPS
jgi:hypothetical protein